MIFQINIWYSKPFLTSLIDTKYHTYVSNNIIIPILPDYQNGKIVFGKNSFQNDQKKNKDHPGGYKQK